MHFVFIFCAVFCFNFNPFNSKGLRCLIFFFNFKMISNMAHAPSLEYFYKTQTGFHFVPEKLIKLLKPSMLSLIMFGIFFFSAFYLCKVKYVILRYGYFVFIVNIFAYLLSPRIFSVSANYFSCFFWTGCFICWSKNACFPYLKKRYPYVYLYFSRF